MRKWMKIVSIVIALLLVSLIATQAVTIHNMKKDQKEQFYEHIKDAVDGLEFYQRAGRFSRYNRAMRNLESARSIAYLLDSSEEYANIAADIGEIMVLLGYCPEHLKPYPEFMQQQLDNLIVALNDFVTDRDLAALDAKLSAVSRELNKPQSCCF